MAQQKAQGTITIIDTNDIERIYVVYAKHTSNIDSSGLPAVNNWTETVAAAPGSGDYVWQRTVIKKTGTNELSYSDPICVTGPEGDAAKNITTIETQYGTSADWNTQPNNWNNNTPNYDSSKPNYWTRTRLKYEDNTYSSWIVSKDYALTKAVEDSILANSIATHSNEMANGAMSQAAANIQTITRLWYAKADSTAPAAPTTHVTTSSVTTYNTWNIKRPNADDSYPYYFYCDETCTGGGTYDWSEVTLDTSTLSQYQIGALTAKVKNFWWDSSGAHVASGKNGNEVTKETISTYGYHALMGLTGISFNYDSVKVVDLNSTTPSLDFYQPPTISGNTVTQGKKTMMLSANALSFYDPTNGTTEQAKLDTNGLVLKKGGIKAGTAGQSGFIYLSTENYGSNLTINSHQASNWREIIGTKFGVDADGNLYASNAEISGKITVGSGSNVYTKTEANGAFDALGAANTAESNAVATAATDATSKANAAQAAAEAAAALDATAKANAVNTALETYKTATNSTLNSLQNQVDGQVEVWYYSIDPTNSNPPASSWDTDTLKARHEGDLYYNINNGHSWRWLKNGSTYSWQQIPDGDAAAALAKATEALGLADNKRRIFTAQPIPPYDIGDLWVNGSQIKYCSTSKAEGQSYSATDWTLTATDDTKANSAAYEEQYIYISKVSGTGSVSKYETWVTSSDDVQNTWTTKRPTYDSSYPVLFIAKQKKTVGQSSGTTCSCTTPVKDDTITVIDGGHITTGTIDAARINVTDLITNNSIVVGSQIENFVTQQDIDDTVEEANKYITAIDEHGITIHPEARTAEPGIHIHEIELNGSGLEILRDGQSLASYGDTLRIGDENGFHIVMTGNKLSFFQKEEEVAYITNNQLYITESVVLQKMDVGTPVSNESGGLWSWKVHKNASGLNNLNLKWIG